MTATLSKSLTAVLALAAGLAAQITTEPQSTGPFVAMPHGFSPAPGTVGTAGPLDPGTLPMKTDGFGGSTPGEWVAPLPGLPDYGSAAILQGVSPRPDIDAFSVGLDWVLADNSGYVDVPPDHWGAVTLSVTTTTVGAAAGGISPSTAIRDAAAGDPDGAAGDLFSFVLPGSTFVPELIGFTQRAQDSTEISLEPNRGTPDVDAHDIFVALLWQQNPDLVFLLPPSLQIPRAFFSVSAATLGRVPTAWWAGTVPSAATVFCTEWMAGAGWTLPTPFLVPSQLGLGVHEDIDGVAVDLARRRLLFGTTTPGRDPILFSRDFGTSCAPTGRPTLFVAPYRDASVDSGDLPVSGIVGLITGDDVDAVCALDPGGDPLLRLLIGTPDPGAGVPTLPARLAASCYRFLDPISQQPFLHGYMAGWPASGRGPGLCGALVAPIFPTNWTGLPVFPNANRNPGNPVGGDPHSIELLLPQRGAPFGLPVFLWWGAVGQAGQLGLAWPVRIDV